LNRISIFFSGTSRIYHRVPPCAIVFASVFIPKPRACPAGPLPGAHAPRIWGPGWDTTNLPAPALPIPCSLFPIPCSLFPIPCSLFPIPCSLPGAPSLRLCSVARVGNHESSMQPAVPYSLFPIPCGLRRITLPGRTMVLSRAKEEGAGAKERRTKGKGNSGTPLPPHPKTPLPGGWLSRQVQQNKQLDRHTRILISKQKPRKSRRLLTRKQAPLARLARKEAPFGAILSDSIFASAFLRNRAAGRDRQKPRQPTRVSDSPDP
jgi:hypothetical protein